MAKVIGRDTSSEAASREAQRRAMDPDVAADYEMDQEQPGAGVQSPAEYEFQSTDPSYPSSESARYDLQIQAVFKRSRPGASSSGAAIGSGSGSGSKNGIGSRSSVYGMPSTMLKRGPMTWIIPTKNLECRCPKIRVNRWVYPLLKFQ